MRLLALPVLALVVGSGSSAGQMGVGAVGERAASATLDAGTARFVVSSGSRHEAGVVDLRNETAVIGNGAIFGASARYWPLPGREASLLGIANKRWTRDATSGYALVDDPFLTGTRSLLDVISRAERVHTLGRAIERGTPVQLYAARVPLQAFLGKFPPFEQETTTKPGDDGPTSYRDYLANYMGADEAGQRLELAVDSQGRIRRVQLDLYEPVTVELYDYGVRVDATAPPASTVTASSAYEQLKSDYCSRPRRQILPRPYPCQ